MRTKTMSYGETVVGSVEKPEGGIPGSIPQGDGADKEFVAPSSAPRSGEIRLTKGAEKLLPADCGVCNLGAELDVDRDTF
jgi:hypothetical protein